MYVQGDLNLNICEAHAFNTLDKFSLDVFVVNGWKGEVRNQGCSLPQAHAIAFGASSQLGSSDAGLSHSKSIPSWQAAATAVH